MNYIIYCVILFVALLLGAFGFAQIIGTIKTWSHDPLPVSLLRIVIWSVLLYLGYLFVSKVIGSAYNYAVYIGYGITFVISLFSKPE